VLALMASTAEASESESELSNVASADLESNASLEQPLVSTTRLGLQRSEGYTDTYVPRTVPERLYKRAQQAHETLDGAYQLTPDIFAPTAAELRAVAAEVSDEALTKAITALKETVVSSRSGRRGAPTRKVILNEVQVQEGFSE
jgi:seryl-tRNA synthetase